MPERADFLITNCNTQQEVINVKMYNISLII